MDLGSLIRLVNLLPCENNESPRVTHDQHASNKQSKVKNVKVMSYLWQLTREARVPKQQPPFQSYFPAAPYALQ